MGWGIRIGLVGDLGFGVGLKIEILNLTDEFWEFGWGLWDWIWWRCDNRICGEVYWGISCGGGWRLRENEKDRERNKKKIG